MRSNYITCDLGGRLGNQMFMIAHGYAKSLEYKRDFFIPKNASAGNCGIEYYTPNMFRKFDVIENIPKTGIYNPSNPIDVDGPIIYVGYYQSEKHFEKYSDLIKSVFSCPSEYAEQVLKKYPQLVNSKVTSIHIRRGDYLLYKDVHPVVSTEYINYTMSLVQGTDYYFVASDDMGWCKQNIHGKNIVFVDGCTPYEQMWIMQLCHNFIISNSSFSWWGAYLSDSKTKRVLAPSTWFSPQSSYNSDGIYCDGWEKIETTFREGFIYPKL